MNTSKNILPSVYSGMSKLLQGGMQGGGVQSGMQGGGDDEYPPQYKTKSSPASRDKILLNLQEQSEQKKALMKNEYKRLKEDIKENPYLKSALEQYDRYFALQQQEVDALKGLLKNIVRKEDGRDIKREISTLEKNLA